MVNLGKAGRDMDYLQRYLIEEEIEDYQNNLISRRLMIRRILYITGSLPVTASILLAAGCGSSPTATSAPVATATRAAAASSAPASAAPASAAPASAAPASAAPSAAASASPAASSAATPATVATPAGAATPAGSPTRAGAASPADGSPAAASPVATRDPVTVQPTDPAIEAGPVQFPGQGGITVFGYLSAPKAATKAPGIVVIHENRGLNEHIRDITRRYAKSGIVALAVDLIRGGTANVADPNQIPSILGQASNREQLVQDMLSAVAYLKTNPKFAGLKVGTVGYCFGGGLVWLLASRSTDIGAAVPYYGTPPPDPIDSVQTIAGPVLAFFGELDTRVTGNVPAIEAAMKKYNKPFEYKIYPGANHAFNNDTGASYNEAAAKDAYPRSVDFFMANLK